MGANLDITEKLQNYINNFGLNLHPVQQEIINYNKTLGDIKRMQIDPTQCHFLHLIIKVSNIKNVLEIWTFTGLSALTISLALPDDGKLIALDKNEETNKIACDFFKKAKQDHKIQTIIKPALESLKELKNNKFDHKDIKAFGILGVSVGLKWHKIQAKFKILVKKFHPDMNSGNKKYEEKLKLITLAYTQLKNTYREKIDTKS